MSLDQPGQLAQPVFKDPPDQLECRVPLARLVRLVLKESPVQPDLPVQPAFRGQPVRPVFKDQPDQQALPERLVSPDRPDQPARLVFKDQQAPLESKDQPAPPDPLVLKE